MSSPFSSSNPLGYTGLDFYNQPPFITAQRAPTTNDIYVPGTQWLDESVSPSLIYETTGNGTWNVGSNAYATSTSPGIVTLSLDIAADAPSNTLVPTVSATKTYVDAVAAFGAPIADEVTQGIGYVASDAEAVARQANTSGVEAFFITPANLTAVMSAPGPIGDTTPSTGAFTTLIGTAVGAAIAFTSDTASSFGVTGAGIDLTLSSASGRVIVNGEEAAANAITLLSAAGGIDVDAALQINIASSQNAVDAIRIVASAGGIDIDAVGAATEDINITNTGGSIVISASENIADAITLSAANGGIDITCGGAATEDIDIANTAGSVVISAGEAVSDAINIDASAGGIDVDAVGQINIDSSQDANDAIVINASAGGVDITATGEAGQDIDIINTGGSINITATENAAEAIYIRTNGGVTETLRLHADQGTGVASINIGSDVGGVTIAGGLGTSDAVNITASTAGGGIDIDSSTGGFDLLTTGGISLDASLASNLTVTGASEDLTLSSSGGSVNITATEAASDAIVMNASDAAGGIQIQAGTGGILIGNQADCTPISVGDIAPTASRTITVGGGTVVTVAVTDTIDIGPDGATTNADSVKTVNVNTGGVTTGQVLTNIATGAVTSGTHTTAIATGNRAAGTMAVNLLTGTGTKTLSIGNADGLTTSSILGPVNINVNQNNDVAINSGTSTGTITIGNTAAGAVVLNSSSTIAIGDASAGAITIDSVAGISLDGATASNFTVTGASQDLTLRSAGGSVAISATEAAADAITINASNAAGGIDISTGGGSIDISSAGFVTMVASTDTQASPSATSVLNVNVGAATFTGFTTAAAASQVFVITNSIVTTSSVILVSIANEGANDAQLTITRVTRSAGAFSVTVVNNGAAALNGNVTISFWVVQA